MASKWVAYIYGMIFQIINDTCTALALYQKFSGMYSNNSITLNTDSDKCGLEVSENYFFAVYERRWLLWIGEQNQLSIL